MTQFLDLIESLPAEQASGERLYGGEGVRARSLAARHPRYQESMTEVMRLVTRVVEGDRYAALKFQEAMATDDFPNLFGDVLDRMLVKAYLEHPSDTERITVRRTVPDFRAVKRFSLDGAESTLPKVKERAEYPETKLIDAVDTYAVEKRGRILDFSWETLVNDDLDAFRDAPARHGKAARRSEARFITELYADASGPHASLYTAGNKNQIVTANGSATNNPALTVVGLQDAYTVLANFRDTESEPIVIDALYLVIPPSLEVTARNIMEGIHIEAISSGGGTAAQNLRAANWLRGKLTVIVDPYLPLVASTANGSTSWFMFSDPSVGRAALELGKLRGHETPEIWVKSANAMRVGGGSVGPEMGDFERDTVRYRIRHVWGGVRLMNTGGFRSTVASNGSGA